MSPVPVREALRILSGEGLITLRARQNFEVPRRSHLEIRSLFRLRRQIEPQLAVERVREHHGVELVEARTLLAREANKTDHTLTHWRIHELLIAGAEQSSTKMRCAVSLIRASWRYLYTPARSAIARSACPLHRAHSALLEAMCNGTLENARNASYDCLEAEQRLLWLSPT